MRNPQRPRLSPKAYRTPRNSLRRGFSQAESVTSVEQTNHFMQTPQPTKARPDPNTYWVAEQLLAGEYPGNRNEQVARDRVQRFINHGVTYFLDLTDVAELAPYAHLLPAEHPITQQPIVHRRMSIKDVSVPKTNQEMVDILDAIEGAMNDGHTVYVHCWGGVGRTGTVIGCYLVRQGYSGPDALVQLKQLWQQCAKSYQRSSPETHAQDDWVRAWRG